ncbi:MAG: hypothetical protein RSB67_03955 [Clostridia bacterium]
MDNAQKAIMIGVGLFITIIIIAAVMLITGMGQDMINNSQSQVSNISSSLQAQLTSDFDGTTVTGAQVVSAIKRYYTDEKMALTVQAVAGKVTKNYGKVAIDGKKNGAIEKIGTLTNTTDVDNYVPSTAKYTANLLKVNEVVIGIKFERQAN